MRLRIASRSGGFGIVGVMVALGISSVVVVALTKFMGQQFSASSSIARLGDLESLKRTFLTSVSCERTLNVAFGTATSAPCGGPYQLRRADGSALPNPVGIFEWRARCVNQSLLIEVKPTKKDPLMNIPPEWRDAFNGTSELCRNFFTASPCPPGQTVLGMAGSVHVCGPQPLNPTNVVIRSASGGSGNFAQVSCQANELRLACGGSREPNLQDSCAEEDCGFVGVIPLGTHACGVGIDSHKNDTNPTVYATCLRVN